MRFFYTTALLLAVVFSFFNRADAQKSTPTVVQGRVTDAETHTPLPFVTVSVPGVSLGTQTDENGRYQLKTERRISEIKFSVIGYEAQKLAVKPGQTQTLDVALSPSAQVLQEVVIRPEKYKKKDNPTRELIEEVIAHRADNHIENLRSYREEQYEKLFFGLSNLGEGIEKSRMLRRMRFVLENRDTSKFDGVSVVPIFLQENVADYYRQSNPKRWRKYVKASRSVTFPGAIDPEGMNKSLQYLYEEIDIYDNYIVLLTDHFLSPIAPAAPLFYRYYPLDTLEEAGRKVVQLQFFPKNKTDMLLQGELFVALDSSFAVTRIRFSVGDGVNLNWVQDLFLEQQFERLPTGKWVLADEDYRLHFGVRPGIPGLVGQRIVSHREPQIDPLLPDSLFVGSDEVIQLPGADTVGDPAFWQQTRPVPLSAVEASTYARMDSMQRTKFYKTMRGVLYTLIGNYAPAGRWVEIGPINALYSFNDLEGTRLRLGGRTSEKTSKHWRLEGYAAYGLRDEKWKYGFGGVWALSGTEFNKFPVNLLRASYQHDVLQPTQSFQGSTDGTLTNSFVRGLNDKFFYHNRFQVQYEREYASRFSWQAGLSWRQFRPGGALRFEPASGGPATTDAVTASAPFVQLRFAPGEKFYQGTNGRLLVNFNYILTAQYAFGRKGLFDGDYDYHQATVSLYKYMDTPPFGYNKTYVEAGGVFGRGLPYPLLAIHPGNQSYIGQQFAYNGMNFLEFISDRYATLITEHYFNGFFLNKIPLLRRLKLREIATVKVLYGSVSAANRPDESNPLFRFPTAADGTPLTYTLENKPYVEASIGVSNIFKIIRVDFVRRFTYLDLPGAARFGVKFGVLMTF